MDYFSKISVYIVMVFCVLDGMLGQREQSFQWRNSNNPNNNYNPTGAQSTSGRNNNDKTIMINDPSNKFNFQHNYKRVLEQKRLQNFWDPYPKREQTFGNSQVKSIRKSPTFSLPKIARPDVRSFQRRTTKMPTLPPQTTATPQRLRLESAVLSRPPPMSSWSSGMPNQQNDVSTGQFQNSMSNDQGTGQFQQQINNNVNGNNAQFQSNTNMNIMQYQQNTNMNSAQYSQTSNLNNAQFQQNSNMNNAQFQQNSNMNNAQSQQNSNMNNAQFQQNSNMNNAQFQQISNMNNAQSQQNSYTNNAQFQQNSNMNTNNAQYQRNINTNLNGAQILTNTERNINSVQLQRSSNDQSFRSLQNNKYINMNNNMQPTRNTQQNTNCLDKCMNTAQLNAGNGFNNVATNIRTTSSLSYQNNGISPTSMFRPDGNAWAGNNAQFSKQPKADFGGNSRAQKMISQTGLSPGRVQQTYISQGNSGIEIIPPQTRNPGMQGNVGLKIDPLPQTRQFINNMDINRAPLPQPNAAKNNPNLLMKQTVSSMHMRSRVVQQGSPDGRINVPPTSQSMNIGGTNLPISPSPFNRGMNRGNVPPSRNSMNSMQVNNMNMRRGPVNQVNPSPGNTGLNMMHTVRQNTGQVTPQVRNGANNIGMRTREQNIGGPPLRSSNTMVGVNTGSPTSIRPVELKQPQSQIGRNSGTIRIPMPPMGENAFGRHTRPPMPGPPVPGPPIPGPPIRGSPLPGPPMPGPPVPGPPIPGPPIRGSPLPGPPIPGPPKPGPMLPMETRRHNDGINKQPLPPPKPTVQYIAGKTVPIPPTRGNNKAMHTGPEPPRWVNNGHIPPMRTRGPPPPPPPNGSPFVINTGQIPPNRVNTRPLPAPSPRVLPLGVNPDKMPLMSDRGNARGRGIGPPRHSHLPRGPFGANAGPMPPMITRGNNRPVNTGPPPSPMGQRFGMNMRPSGSGIDVNGRFPPHTSIHNVPKPTGHDIRMNIGGRPPTIPQGRPNIRPTPPFIRNTGQPMIGTIRDGRMPEIHHIGPNMRPTPPFGPFDPNRPLRIPRPTPNGHNSPYSIPMPTRTTRPIRSNSEVIRIVPGQVVLPEQTESDTNQYTEPMESTQMIDSKVKDIVGTTGFQNRADVTRSGSVLTAIPTPTSAVSSGKSNVTSESNSNKDIPQSEKYLIQLNGNENNSNTQSRALSSVPVKSMNQVAVSYSNTRMSAIKNTNSSIASSSILKGSKSKSNAIMYNSSYVTDSPINSSTTKKFSLIDLLAIVRPQQIITKPTTEIQTMNPNVTQIDRNSTDSTFGIKAVENASNSSLDTTEKMVITNVDESEKLQTSNNESTQATAVNTSSTIMVTTPLLVNVTERQQPLTTGENAQKGTSTEANDNTLLAEVVGQPTNSSKLPTADSNTGRSRVIWEDSGIPPILQLMIDGVLKITKEKDKYFTNSEEINFSSKSVANPISTTPTITKSQSSYPENVPSVEKLFKPIARDIWKKTTTESSAVTTDYPSTTITPTTSTTTKTTTKATTATPKIITMTNSVIDDVRTTPLAQIASAPNENSANEKEKSMVAMDVVSDLDSAKSIKASTEATRIINDNFKNLKLVGKTDDKAINNSESKYMENNVQYHPKSNNAGKMQPNVFFGLWTTKAKDSLSIPLAMLPKGGNMNGPTTTDVPRKTSKSSESKTVLSKQKGQSAIHSVEKQVDSNMKSTFNHSGSKTGIERSSPKGGAYTQVPVATLYNMLQNDLKYLRKKVAKLLSPTPHMTTSPFPTSSPGQTSEVTSTTSVYDKQEGTTSPLKPFIARKSSLLLFNNEIPSTVVQKVTKTAQNLVLNEKIQNNSEDMFVQDIEHSAMENAGKSLLPMFPVTTTESGLGRNDVNSDKGIIVPQLNTESDVFPQQLLDSYSVATLFKIPHPLQKSLFQSGSKKIDEKHSFMAPRLDEVKANDNLENQLFSLKASTTSPKLQETSKIFVTTPTTPVQRKDSSNDESQTLYNTKFSPQPTNYLDTTPTTTNAPTVSTTSAVPQTTGLIVNITEKITVSTPGNKKDIGIIIPSFNNIQMPALQGIPSDTKWQSSIKNVGLPFFLGPVDSKMFHGMNVKEPRDSIQPAKPTTGTATTEIKRVKTATSYQTSERTTIGPTSERTTIGPTSERAAVNPTTEPVHTTPLSQESTYRERKSLKVLCKQFLKSNVYRFIYVPHPSDCSKMIQCTPVENDIEVLVRHCPLGLFWDSNLLQCSDPRQVSCFDDPCQKGLFNYSGNGGCGNYYKCFGGVSVPQCCPPGHRFEQKAANFGECIKTTVCTDQCETLSTSHLRKKESCPSIADEYNKDAYWVMKHGSLQIEQCPDGSNYDQNLCNCKGTSIPRKKITLSPKCRPEFMLTFEKGRIRDVSEGGLAFSRSNVRGTDNSTAIFKKDSYISIWGFQNRYLGRMFSVKIRMRIEDGSCDNGRRNIIANCGPGGQPSVEVACEKGQIQYKAKTDSYSGPLIATTGLKDGTWTDITYTYDDNFFSGSVHKRKFNKPMEGNLESRNNPLIIGKCPQTPGFKGQIDQVEIYTHCVP